MGKNDKPYGILVLEDYSGTKEFRLFGENYIQFRNYFIIGALLHFSASIIKRSWDGTLSVKFNEINLLSDVSKKLMNEINFRINLNDIDDNFITKFMEVIKKYPGKHNLKLNIYDQKVNLNFLSKKYQVSICKKLINDMHPFSKQYILK